MPDQRVEIPSAITNSAAPFCSQPRRRGPSRPNSTDAKSMDGRVPAPKASISSMPSGGEGAVVAWTAMAMVMEQGIMPFTAPLIAAPRTGPFRVAVANSRRSQAAGAKPQALRIGETLLVPAGTGVLIMANRNVHVFDNEIGDHGTANVIVSAYRAEFQDPNYNPLPRNIMIRDNRFGNAGFAPSGELAALAQAGVALPDVLWDGSTLYSVGGSPRSENVRIVVRDNRSTRTRTGTFLSLGLPVAGSPFSEAAPDQSFPPLLDIEEPEEVEIDD